MNHGGKLHVGVGNNFFGYDNIKKKRQQKQKWTSGTPSNLSLLQSKRKDEQNEKATYRMGENIKIHI